MHSAIACAARRIDKSTGHVSCELSRARKKACEDAKVLKQIKLMKQNLQAPRNRVQKKGIQSG